MMLENNNLLNRGFSKNFFFVLSFKNSGDTESINQEHTLYDFLCSI